MSVDEFAAQCLISAKSVNNYEGDKVAQRPLVVEKWAAVTGVSLHWLQTGQGEAGGPSPDGPGIDPDTKPETDALTRLTQSKLSRSRHAGGGSTQQYPQVAEAA